jgi:hypothetical protein
MKSKSILIFVIFIFLTVSSSVSYSQQLQKIFDVPGGGSGTTNTNVSENKDNTMLYVVGAAVVVGIVVYALLKDIKDNSKTDTTAAFFNDEFLVKQLTLNDQILKYKSQIPINISIGMENDIIRKEDKRYFVGMNYNF